MSASNKAATNYRRFGFYMFLGLAGFNDGSNGFVVGRTESGNGLGAGGSRGVLHNELNISGVQTSLINRSFISNLSDLLRFAARQVAEARKGISAQSFLETSHVAEVFTSLGSTESYKELTRGSLEDVGLRDIEDGLEVITISQLAFYILACPSSQ